MYSTNTLQVQELVNNVIRSIKKDQGKEIEIEIQSEAALQMEEYRRAFCNNLNRNDENKRISVRHKKTPTIYSDHRLINIA